MFVVCSYESLLLLLLYTELLCVNLLCIVSFVFICILTNKHWSHAASR